jgi:hypothetical protein
MLGYGSCGSPCCALGHYAWRRDLQQTFELIHASVYSLIDDAEDCCFDGSVICEHFGLTRNEANALFSERGCGQAITALDAARYIERFAEATWPESPAPVFVESAPELADA